MGRRAVDLLLDGKTGTETLVEMPVIVRGSL
jgi:hypothetical protein